MDFVGSLSLLLLCAPSFGVFVSLAVELCLEFSAFLELSISLSLAIGFPTLVLQLALAIETDLALGLELAVVLPDLSIDFNLALGIRLQVLLALKAALDAAIAVGGASLQVLAWEGTGAGFGPAVSGSIGGGWPDGHPSADSCTAIVLVATSGGGAGTLSGTKLLAGGQGYEAGLVGVQVEAPPLGGIPATATASLGAGGAVTGVSIGFPGAGYVKPPRLTITDSVTISAASGTTPVEITIPDTTGLGGVRIAPLVGDPFQATTAITGATTATLWKPLAASIVAAEDNGAGLVLLTLAAPAAGAPTATTGAAAHVLGGTAAAIGDWTLTVIDQTHVVLDGSTWAGPFIAGGMLAIPLCAPVAPGPSLVGGTCAGAGGGAAASVVMGGGSMAALPSFFPGLPFVPGALVSASIGLASLCSLSFSALVDLQTRLALQIGAARSQLAFSATISPFPPTFAFKFDLNAKITAGLTAAIAVVPPLPSVKIMAQAAVAADLAVLASLSARVCAVLGLGDAELLVYKYTGPGSGLGPAITAACGSAWPDATPATAPCVAMVLGATTPVARTALGVFFAGA